ncbi:type I secretion C-terminal target domain-containing protein [Vibrio vulnificus]|uniref:type I secretion C-terminal target domain-containing protein n=1 Tax=Vibrio vulnificus TaxID=672 RepID=UPI001EEDBCA3|nr:type I secretion C-terminal target domain-containing protein [Vibrio vulnificus]
MGGIGSDILTGGDGADIFLWRELETAEDRVTDFDFSQDKLELRDIFEDCSNEDISQLLDSFISGSSSASAPSVSVSISESEGATKLSINKDNHVLEVSFDGASTDQIAESIIANLSVINRDY